MLETLDRIGGQRNLLDAGALAKGESQRTAIRGRIVILRTARDPQPIGLDFTTRFSQLISRSRNALPRRQRRGQSHTHGRRSTKSRADREIAGQLHAHVANAGGGAGGMNERRSFAHRGDVLGVR